MFKLKFTKKHIQNIVIMFIFIDKVFFSQGIMCI